MYSVYENNGRVFVAKEDDLLYDPEVCWGHFDTKSEADDEAAYIAYEHNKQWGEMETERWYFGPVIVDVSEQG